MTPQPYIVRTEEAIERFNKKMLLAGRSPATLKSYAASLKKLADAAECLPCTEDQVMTALLASEMKRNSRGHMLRVLHAFFKAVQADYPEIPDPTDGLRDFFRAVPEEDPRVLTKAETDSLVAVARASGHQDFLLVLTFLDTAVRVGEMASIRAASIRDHWVHVNGKRGPRRVPISTFVAEMLLAHQVDGVIWQSATTGSSMTVSAIQKRIRRLFEESGMEGKKMGPHTLRHSSATKFIERGGDVAILQKILGHSTLAQTDRYVTLAGRPVLAQHAEKSPALDYAPQRQSIPLPRIITATPAFRQTPPYTVYWVQPRRVGW